MAISNPQHTFVSNFNAVDQPSGVELLTNAKGHFYPLSHIFKGDSLGNGMMVVPNDPVSNSVAVKAGYIQIPTTDDFAYQAWMDEDIAITPAAMQDPTLKAISSIVAYINIEKEYTETVTNNPGLMVIEEITSDVESANPVPMTDSQISEKINGFPFVRLANIYKTGGSAVYNATNIVDTRKSLSLADNMELGEQSYSGGIIPASSSTYNSHVKIAIINAGDPVPAAEPGSDLLVFQLAS